MSASHIFAVLMPFFFSSCGYYLERYPQDLLNGGRAKSALDFESVKTAVFTPYCVRCHVQYGQYRSVKTEVIAIAAAVNSGRMPKGLGSLASGEKKILNDWIAVGAPEMAGGSNEGGERLPLRAEWNSLAENIFVPRCVVCHNPQGQARFLDLSTREAVLNSKDRVFSTGQKLLDTASPASSYILAVIQDEVEPMPPKSTNIPRLNAEEVQTIFGWISLGLP